MTEEQKLVRMMAATIAAGMQSHEEGFDMKDEVVAMHSLDIAAAIMEEAERRDDLRAEQESPYKPV